MSAKTDRTIELPEVAEANPNPNAVVIVPIVDVSTTQDVKDYNESIADPRVQTFDDMTLAEIDAWIGDKVNINDSTTLFQVICRMLVMERSKRRTTSGS